MKIWTYSHLWLLLPITQHNASERVYLLDGVTQLEVVFSSELSCQMMLCWQQPENMQWPFTSWRKHMLAGGSWTGKK